MSKSCNILTSDLVIDAILNLEIEEYNDLELKELVKTIKSQTNEGKLPINDKVLSILTEAIIESAEEDEVELNTNYLDDKITKYWNESTPSRSSLDNTKYNSGEYQEFPRISSGLDSIFSKSTDRGAFSKWAQNVLVNSSAVNPVTGDEVATEYNLNASLLDLQNDLAVSLAEYLNIEPKNIYDGIKFNEAAYNDLVNAARLNFYSYLDEGKYDFPSKGIRGEFNKYLLLTNFDSAIQKYANGIIVIDPIQVNRKELFSRGSKYKAGSLHVKQRWDDSFEASSIGIHTNKSVQQYISSLPEINAKGVLTGNSILFRDFNNLIRIIKDKNPNYSKMLREYPGEALKATMDEIYKNPRNYFTGNDTILLNTFYTVYNNVFGPKDISLYSKNTANTRSTKNNLYSMIVNHINKNASMEYTQTIWDEEEETYKTALLSSTNLTKTKSDVSRNLILHAIKDDYSSLVEKYNVVFNTTNGKIQSLSFKIGEDNYVINFNKNNTPSNVKSVIAKFSNPEYVEFFNDVFKQRFDKDFYAGLLIANESSPSSVFKLLNLASNIFLSNKLGSNITYNIASGKVIDGTFSDNTRSWFSNDLGAVRVDGFNGALDAVEVLARAKSYISKDSTQSNVKNSEGASLPKFGLTSLSEGDKYLFRNLFKQVVENPNHTLRHNLFMNNKIYGMMRNTFKTEFIGYDGDSQQIKNMSDAELIYDGIVSGYFANKKKFVSIQPAVYADKGKIQAKAIRTDEKFTYVNIDGETIINDKSFSELSTDELDNLYYESMRSQMINLKKTIVEDYKKFFGALHSLYPKKYPEANYNKWEEYEPLVNKLSKNDIYVAIKLLQSKGEDISIIPEIHFTWNKKAGKYIFNNLLAFEFKRYTSNNRDIFNEKNRIEETLYAETLRSGGVRLSTVLANGLENKIITSGYNKFEDQTKYLSDRLPESVVKELTKNGSTYEDIWVNKSTKELRGYLAFDKNGKLIKNAAMPLYSAEKDLGITVVLNPELYKFQRLDNIVSNNYNLATVGLPFLHPTKVQATGIDSKSIKIEEANRTVAFSKRGVIYGGTGHTLIKNKKDGIPQYLNISVIDDLTAPNMSLTGNNEDATTQDGAIHTNPFFSIWFQNSSPELTHSSVHEKPLGYSSLSKYGASTLFKCATFSITNSSIRSSETSKVNKATMLKNMSDRPWVIPNLDISPYFQSVYYIDPELDLNRYFELTSLEKVSTDVVNGKVDNIYKAQVMEVDSRGNIIGSETETKILHLNSNYDIWKAFGGAYSCSLSNGKLEPSEDSIHQVARIANDVNIYEDSDEIAEYNDLVKFGRLSNPKLAEISKIKDIRDVPQYSNKLIPEKHLKIEGGRTYYQPMKYSDIHYLANASGVKNGIVNPNPASLYFNSTQERINPNSRVIFGHPTLGKTVASKMGYNFISFDDYNRDKIKNYIAKNKLEGETTQQFKKRRDPAYQEFLLSLLEENLDLNVPIFFSDLSLLDAINNSDEIVIDEIYTMSEENFIERNRQRGGTDDANAREWKHNLDEALNTYLESIPDTKVVDATGHDLFEYFDSPLLSSEFDPAYLIIQLTAEHDVENEQVSEMTQVISALEQGSYTHDIAIKILSDIGQTISDRLDLYRKWDINTEVGRQELNTILGRALCRVFNDSEDRISIASAYLDRIQEELAKSNIITQPIPFDDNNLLGMFETNFRNGFNKDIIKRKFSGFTGVMTPCFDLYSVYDYNSNVITEQDFSRIAEKNGTSNIKETLTSLDVEVPVSQIRCGDWIELNGQAVQVGTLVTTFGNTPSITLEEVKSMRGQTVKKLTSKGRNLRAQNYVVTVNPDQVNVEDSTFDIYDLDSVLLSSKLKQYVKEFNLEQPQYLDQVFIEVNELIKAKYLTVNDKGESRTVDLIPYLKEGNIDKLKSYIKVAIQEDMKSIQSGKYPVPIKYRNGSAQADIITSEYTPNELAVGKPFASKFLLSPGDTISSIDVEFFKNKLRERRSNPIDSKFYNLYFVGNNYKLNFSYDPNIIKKLRSAGYTVSEKNIQDQIITANEGLIRRINDDIKYPVNKNMAFYDVTTPDGETVEMVTGFSNEDIKNIWNTESFYTNNFNFSNFDKEYNDEETLSRNFKRLSNLLKLYGSLNKIKVPIKSYQEAFEYISKINPEAEDTKRAFMMNQSFNEALKVIAARIPAQSMQSFMNMKIASFIDTDTNIVYTPIEMLIYEGSDFDIDKIYVMNSSIGDNGVYINWSPYFMWETTDLFNKSKELPLPNGKTYTVDESGIDVSEYNDLESLYEGKQYSVFLDRLAEMLEKIKETNIVSGASDYLLNIINTHNKFQYNKNEGVKNKIFNNMFKVGADPRNFLAETATLTIDPAREAASKSTAGRFGEVSSNENPGAKMVAQKENAVGKSSIGAFANGIKAFSSLLVFYQDNLSKVVPMAKQALDNFLATISVNLGVEPELDVVLSRLEELSLSELINSGLSEEEAKLVLEARKEDFRQSDKSMEHLNLLVELLKLSDTANVEKYELKLKGSSSYTAYDSEGKPFEIKFTPTLPNLNLSAADGSAISELVDKIKKGGLQEEVYETLGVMLNISTDNAKELVLKKINASGDLAKVYIYLISSGVPFTTITKFMTSSVISLVNNKAQRSLFNEESKYSNINRAIKFYQEGADIADYVGKDFVNSVINVLNTKIDSQIPTKAAEFKKFIKDSGSDYLYTLIDKITEHESDFSVTASRVLSQDEIEQLREIADELGEEGFVANRRDFKQTAFLVNRFLTESINRKNQLATIKGDINNTLELLNNLVEGGDEISEYSQWCGLNQGLKTLRNDFYNFIKRREDFIKSKTGKNFDLIQFIKDPEYRQHQINLYEKSKTTFNVLAAISSSPHFSKMYQALALNEDILNTFSYKYRTFSKMADLLVHRGIVKTIKPDTMRVIKRFVDDVTISEFFDNLSFEIPMVGEVLPYYNADGSTSKREEEVLQLNDVFGRASFKRIMENYIIPELQNKYPTNRFLSDLMFGYTKTSFGVRDFLKLPIDLNNISSEMNENLFNDYVSGFNSIKDDTYNNVRIEDLFFAYNLLVSNNGFGPNTMTRIFEDAIKSSPKNSIISKFTEFEANLPNMDINIDEDDLLIRFAGETGSGFDVQYVAGKKVIYHDGKVQDLFIENNPTSLFFRDGVSRVYKIKADNIYVKFMNLFADNKLDIKLTCDE